MDGNGDGEDLALRDFPRRDGTKAPKLIRRRKGWTTRKERLFLECLARTANVREATRACAMPYGTPYYRREVNPQFRRDWETALLLAYDALEQRMLDHGINGVRTKVRFQGQVVDEDIVFNETVAFNLLRLHKGNVARLRDKRAEELDRDPDEIERALESKLALIEARLKGGSEAECVEG